MQSERRTTIDRRQLRSPFNLHSVYGRRRGLRREDDAHGRGCTDSYGPHLFFVSVSILLFCAADAHNTLLLLGLGGSELNPVMDALIRQDIRLFVLFKLALTGLGLLALVGYEYVTLWKRFRARHLLYLILVGYVVLIGYQSMLIPEGVPAVVLH